MFDGTDENGSRSGMMGTLMTETMAKMGHNIDCVQGLQGGWLATGMWEVAEMLGME